MNLGQRTLCQRNPDYLHLHVPKCSCWTKHSLWVLPGFFHSLHEIAGFSLSGNEDQTRVGEGFPTKLNETSLQKGTAQTQLQEPGFFEVL